jgi:hypothetical protein
VQCGQTLCVGARVALMASPRAGIQLHLETESPQPARSAGERRRPAHRA